MSTDILILGAGIAGLRAADLLSTKGMRITILEARDRLGGRLHTIDSPHLSVPLELGAEFVHGHPPQTFKLLDEARLTAYDISDNHRYLRGGKLAENPKFWDEVERVLARLSRYKRNDISFADFLSRQHDIAPAARIKSRDFVEGFDAADTKKIGVQGLAVAQAASDKIEGDLMFRPLGGYRTLVDYLVEKITASPARRAGPSPARPPVKIHLNTIVRQIEWSRNNCRVHAITNGKPITYTAKKVLVTLPLGILKSGDITFSPEVPGLAKSLAALEMGPVIKLLLVFRSCFWGKSGFHDLNFFHASNLSFPTWWTQLPLRVPLLTGWAGGPSAAVLTHRPQKEILDAGLTSLARLLHTSRSSLSRQLKQYHVANWPADPFSRGAYSYVATNGLLAARRFHKLGDGILYFAGEHTEPALIGTVAAALASAERIACLMRIRND